MDPIVNDELELLARVSRLLAERPFVTGPKEDDLINELVRLRDEIPRAKEEDKGSLLQQYHQHVSVLERIRESKQRAQVDPDSPYFAHLRLEENGQQRDLCLGKATRIEEGVRIVDTERSRSENSRQQAIDRSRIRGCSILLNQPTNRVSAARGIRLVSRKFRSSCCDRVEIRPRIVMNLSAGLSSA